ncbi:Uncharacterised protein g8630 [Pycnogonum litorale]
MEDFPSSISPPSIENLTNLTSTHAFRSVESCNVDCMKAYAYRMIAPIVIGVGILGNILNLIVLTRPNLKGVTYIYLQWLSISDLLALVFAIPLIARITGVHLKSYYFAIYHAYFELALLNLFLSTSVFIVICVTVDRFFSICLPTKYKDIHTPKRSRIAVILSFVSAILLYIPIVFRKEIIPLNNNSSTPQYTVQDKANVVNNEAYRTYILIRECVCRFCPLIILAVLNASIIICFRRVVKKRERMFSGSISNTRSAKKENKRFQEERRLVILLIGVVVLFLCCITPSAVNMLFISDDLETNFTYQVFRAAANILEFVNSSLNFFVYCLCSSEIRNTLFNLLGCKKKRTTTMNLSQSRPSDDAHIVNTRSTRF